MNSLFFVIVALFSAIAHADAAPVVVPPPVVVAPGVLLVGRIQSTNINESSGLLPAHRDRGAYWTHNDGDNSLFGITAFGHTLGKWSIGGPLLHDWEDIAWTPGRIYIADTGNNELLRTNVFVYAAPEPSAAFSGSLPLKGVWELSYPNHQPFDAESLLVVRQLGYVIAKDRVDGAVRVYRFPFGRKRKVELQPQCELEVSASVAGADLTPDNQKLAVITDDGAYLFAVASGIPESGRLQPMLFVPFRFENMEACCFTAEGLLVTAETGEIILFTHDQFKAVIKKRR
ncbi:MAG TPA: hypothetical protein VK846_08470 [Candidatus Limnocylindria bacterium]|nr:hypothetical protein [Candidatus Limnocylindria bacterium]